MGLDDVGGCEGGEVRGGGGVVLYGGVLLEEAREGGVVHCGLLFEVLHGEV